MSLFDTLLATFAPHDCLGCGAEGALACDACMSRLSRPMESCYRCKKPSPGSRTCAQCRVVSPIRSVQAGAKYEGLAKDLVWKLKFHGSQAAAKIMARQMAEQLTRPATNTIIVPVPTATTRVRQRGYDQASLLARALARELHIPYANCLARLGQQHQVGASRQEHLHQLSTAFRVIQPQLVPGANIVLVDDVLTTGATLQTAAQVLKDAGAHHLDAAVFARA